MSKLILESAKCRLTSSGSNTETKKRWQEEPFWSARLLRQNSPSTPQVSVFL